jgi:hypothetical protein
MVTCSNESGLTDQITNLAAGLILITDTNTGKKKELFVPTESRQITEAKLYSLNEINSNRKQQQEPNYEITKIENVLATIPFKNDGYLDLTKINIRKREYFGPVKIDRLEIMLKNDRGYLVNLNGRDWTLNIILEQLYQF